MKNMRQFLRRNQGIATLEFVIVLPILLLLIFGIIEFGFAWYSQILLTNASREGARFGTLYTTVERDDPNGEVTTYVQQVLSAVDYPGTINNITCTGAGGTSGDLVTVQVSGTHEFPVLSSLAGLDVTINLRATTAMRHE